MKHHYLSSLYVCCALLSSCSSIDSTRPFDQAQAAKIVGQFYVSKPTQQMIELTLPKQHYWKTIDLSYNKVGSPVMLIPMHESPTDWNESIRTKINGYPHQPDITARKLVQNEIDAATQQCSEVNSKIIKQTDQSVTYQLTLSGCSKEKNQLQIGKAFNGTDAVYLVYYTAKLSSVSEAEIHKMSYVIQSAQLIRNSR